MKALPLGGLIIILRRISSPSFRAAGVHSAQGDASGLDGLLQDTSLPQAHRAMPQMARHFSSTTLQEDVDASDLAAHLKGTSESAARAATHRFPQRAGRCLRSGRPSQGHLRIGGSHSPPGDASDLEALLEHLLRRRLLPHRDAAALALRADDVVVRIEEEEERPPLASTLAPNFERPDVKGAKLHLDPCQVELELALHVRHRALPAGRLSMSPRNGVVRCRKLFRHVTRTHKAGFMGLSEF